MKVRHLGRGWPQLRTPGWDTSHTRQRAFCRSFCWWLVSVCGGCSNALITINSDRKSHRLMSGWQPSGSLFPTRKNVNKIPDPHSIASSSRLLDLVLRISNIKAIIAAAQYRCFNVKIFGKNNKHKWGGRVELPISQLSISGWSRVRCSREISELELEIQTKAIRRFVIMEKAPTRAFSWLKAATTAFTFKTLLRHYAKRSLNVKLGPRLA